MRSKNQNIRVVPDILKNLVGFVERGEYRIPQFQREFVWEKQRVIELFDSIYHEYPIGSFFLWEAGRAHNRLFRHSIDLNIPPIAEDDRVTFILDGQQRITSIYVTLMGLTAGGTDFSRICFDVKKQEFTYREPDPSRFIPVCNIWEGNILKIAKQLEDEYHNALARCDQILQTYPISIVEVRDKELSDVCTIFQRINQAGKRLDRFDLIAAMTFSPEFDLRERFKEDLLARLQQKSFGPISPVVVTQLMALVKKGACTERVEFSLTGPEIREMWETVVDSVLLAADTLRKAVGVQSSTYLPYEAILTLVAYAFFQSGRRAFSDSEVEWIKKWFWRVSFSQHYGSAGPTKMGRDKELFDRLLAGEFPSFEPQMALTVESLVETRMTSSRSAIRNAFLCLLAHRGPVHLRNNTPLDLVTGGLSGFTNPEKHHIFPQAFLRTRGYGESAVFALPNFCFVPAELNKLISDTKPSVYVPRLEQENSHFVDAAATHLLPIRGETGFETDNYELFLETRGELILNEIERLAGVSTAPVEGQEFRAIRELETRLRDQIHATLSEAHGHNYWKTAIPEDVRLSVESKAANDLHKNPEHKPELFSDSRQKLEYCDFSDYSRLILVKNNWPHFEDMFRRRVDIERRMEGIMRFRNALSHSRTMTEVDRQDGRAALVWFRNVMSPTSVDFIQLIDLDENDHAIEDNDKDTAFPPLSPPDTPNEKNVEAHPEAPPISNQAEAYRKFMQSLMDELRDVHSFTNARIAGPKGGYGFPSGFGGVYYAFDFAKRGRVRVSVYIDTGYFQKNKALFDAMHARREEIERKFGESFEWERLDSKRAARFGVYRQGTIKNSAKQLADIRTWALELLLRLKSVVGPVLAELPGSNPSPPNGDVSHTSREWDEDSLLEAIENNVGADVVEVTRKILEWARINCSYISWGEGNFDGSFSAVVDYGAKYTHIPFVIFTDGKVTIKFLRMKNRHPPFTSVEKRLELLHRLNQIPGVSLSDDSIDRLPRIPLTTLRDSNALGRFLATIQWTIDEIKSAAL